MKNIFLSLSTIAVLAIFTACNSGQNKQDTNTGIDSPTEPAAETMKCGEGKCGEGKCGEGKGTEKKSKFASMDADGNGSISMGEFTTYVTSEFANKDTNADGKITEEECGHFSVLNTDGDDSISEEEFKTGLSTIFSSMDKDGDGAITKEEMKAHMANKTNEAEAKCGEGK